MKFDGFTVDVSTNSGERSKHKVVDEYRFVVDFASLHLLVCGCAGRAGTCIPAFRQGCLAGERPDTITLHVDGSFDTGADPDNVIGRINYHG